VGRLDTAGLRWDDMAGSSGLPKCWILLGTGKTRNSLCTVLVTGERLWHLSHLSRLQKFPYMGMPCEHPSTAVYSTPTSPRLPALGPLLPPLVLSPSIPFSPRRPIVPVALPSSGPVPLSPSGLVPRAASSSGPVPSSLRRPVPLSLPVPWSWSSSSGPGLLVAPSPGPALSPALVVFWPCRLITRSPRCPWPGLIAAPSPRRPVPPSRPPLSSSCLVAWSSPSSSSGLVSSPRRLVPSFGTVRSLSSGLVLSSPRRPVPPSGPVPSSSSGPVPSVPSPRPMRCPPP
jgi:hypothetical protein